MTALTRAAMSPTRPPGRRCLDRRGRADTDYPGAAPVDDSARWELPSGVQSLGEVKGSGLRVPTFLVERGDGQMLQVSALLHAVIAAARPGQRPTSLAAAVSAATGRTLSVEGLDHLARTKLEPMGLLVDAAAQPVDHPAPPRRATPVLALSLKATLIPASVVRPLARGLAVLFWTPVMVVAVAAVIVLDVVLATRVDPITALEQVLMTPELLLMLFVLLTAGAVIHETGHAAGCSAGGAEPGAIGVGVYLLFPAFYTDVTASYRLDRVGRLRTDLGGLYFNVWCLLAAGGGFLLTGQPVLLLVVLLMHIEMAQQLVPTVRFDGYFVLSDIAGVPDPFSRVLPVLRSLAPGRPVDPRVAELRPRARRLITGWVLLVVPTLTFGLGWLIWNLPKIVTTSVIAVSTHAQLLADAWGRRDVVSGTLAALAIVLMAVPLLGIAIVLPRALLLPLGRAARRRTPGRAPESAGAGADARGERPVRGGLHRRADARAAPPAGDPWLAAAARPGQPGPHRPRPRTRRARGGRARGPGPASGHRYATDRRHEPQGRRRQDDDGPAPRRHDRDPAR